MIITANATLVDALARLDATAKGILLVVDEEERLIGTLTDGDIRRCILRCGGLNAIVLDAVHRHPVTIAPERIAEGANLLAEAKVSLLPVIDEDGRVVDCLFADGSTITQSQDHEKVDLPVIMMAGGLGTRLYPYTKILPKPLIPVNDVPIAERIINQFYSQGCRKFTLIVNHKKEMIKAYFKECEGDFEVDFVEEGVFLGTGGGLGLLRGRIDSTFILTNCDILVRANMANALELHQSDGNAVTMFASLKNYEIPYGTVEIDEGGSISRMVEKPRIPFLVNTGCYLVEPYVLDLIAKDEEVGFPDVIKRCQEHGFRTGIYPISEDSWMDMGQLDELRAMSMKVQ